ncbi:WD40 repeat domain-containing protein, partial [bacterium]|nr:WD40 repeat domain-containing protein [bacterium]
IRAGLIPALSPETYTIIYVRTLKSPANEIKQELIEQLGRDDRHLNLDLLDFLTRETEYISKTVVIVLDQFEEFFIRFPQSVRQVFEKELSDCFQVPHLDIKVIISMRSDYFSFLAEFEHFYPEIFNRQFHLHPLTEEQGLEAIIKPLQLLEVEVDESMVRTSLLPGLISDGKIEPPLLQIVCDALYGNLKSRGGNEVDILDLEAVGNVHGAINQYLEKCLRQFGPYQQAAKSVLKSMVTSQDTRHAAFLDELTSRVQTSGLNIASEELDKKYLAKFIRQRLVRIETIGGKASFELSHEVLVQQISDWIDENERELKETLQLIDQSFETHQLKGLLLSKKNIKTISPLRSQIHLASEKEIFLKKSSNRWRRKKLTNWSLTVSSLLLFVLFIVLVAYELPQPSAIDDAKREKDWGVVLQVYLEVLEGRDDWRIPYDIKITGTLENMFSSSDKGKAEEISIESPPIIVEKDNFDNNQGVVTPEVSEKIKKVELIIPELSGLPYKWEKIEKRKILRDIETATEWFTPVIGVFTWEKPLLKAKFSPDGKMIAAGSEDKSVIIWDTDSGKRVAHLTGHTSNIIDLVFNPNQSHLATAGADGTILIWDLRTYKQEHKLKGSQLSITSIDYSPNGHVLASGSADSSIQLWDTLTHQPLKLLKGHKKSINALRFHPAKNFLVSASNDLSIRWWNIETGRVMRIFWGHKAAVIALDFDTKFNLISSGLDNIRLWRLNSTHKQVIAQGSKAIRINRGNNSLVFVNRDNALKFLYSVDHDFPDHYFGISRCCENRNQITAMNFNPSGSMMISTSGRRIYLWLIAKSLKPLKNQLISTEKPTDWETRETQIKKILSLGTAYEKLYLSENEDPPGYYVSWEKSPEELHKAWLKAAQNAEIPWFEDGG